MDIKEHDPNEESFRIFTQQEIEAKNKGITTYYRSSFGASFTPFAFVTINGKEIARKFAVEVKLTQTLSEHTFFELLIPSEAFSDKGTYPLQNSKELLGASAVIELKQFGKITFTCLGEVTRIGYQVKNKYPFIKLTGKSPTWKMDAGRQCRSFENQTLEQIVKAIAEPYRRNGISIKIAPRTKEVFEYIVMSNESPFEFLRRLAIRYGEYFFWNGTILIFGRAGMNRVKLQEGRDFHQYTLDIQAQPQHFTYEAYDNTEAVTHSIDSRHASTGIPFNPTNPFQRKAVSASENLFPDSPASYSRNFLGRGKAAFTQTVLRQKELRRNTACLTAKTDNPHLRLGSVVDAEAWVRKYLSFENEHVAIEQYTVTQITHFYSSKGYSNEFTAVPFEQEVAPNMDETQVPISEPQSAVVMETHDPEGLNRIRVQFPWQKALNQMSPWIQLMQSSYAGEGYGMHMIPEKGTEVLVFFQGGGNAEMPVALGSLYNGKQKSEYATSDNDIKALKTRSGVQRVINDAQGSIEDTDTAGSFIKWDGEGNMDLNAVKNMNITVGETLTIRVGKDMFDLVEGNKKTEVMQGYILKANTSKANITGDKEVTVGGDLTETTSTTTHTAKSGDILFYSTNIATFYGNIDTKVNKG